MLVRSVERAPLDHPFAGRPHRVYVALTNHCNRSCPWCSTYSSPRGDTWLGLDAFRASFPAEGAFEVQLEGGEPTLHPRFGEFVAAARSHPRCQRLVLCTNGAVLPRTERKLRSWLERLGEPLTLKLSVNHYLLERDPELLALAVLARALMSRIGGDRMFVINLRRRKGVEDDDREVLEAVKRAGLLDCANDFFLQRYGLASDQMNWDPPFLVGKDFRMVNPDGRIFGPHLMERTEAMGMLP